MPETRRLFFAIYPELPVLERLIPIGDEVAAVTGGRRVEASNLHITLAFLGEVPPDRLGRLAEIAAGLTANVFEISFSAVECWQDVKVAALVSDRPPAALMDLAHELHGQLRASGLLQHSYAYRPHVTLAKNVQREVAPLVEFPIAWQAHSFALVESIPGSGYRRRAEWLLGDGQSRLFPSQGR